MDGCLTSLKFMSVLQQELNWGTWFMIYEHVTVYICDLERAGSLFQCAVWLEGDVIRTLKHLIHCEVENWFTGKTNCTESLLINVKCYIHVCLQFPVVQKVEHSASNDKVIDFNSRKHMHCKLKCLLHDDIFHCHTLFSFNFPWSENILTNVLWRSGLRSKVDFHRAIN